MKIRLYILTTVSLMLFAFTCKKEQPQNTSQEVYTTTDTLTTTALEEEISYRIDSPNEQFAAHNKHDNACNIAIKDFIKSTNIKEDIEHTAIYVHNRTGDKVILNLQGNNSEHWIEMDLEQMQATDITDIEEQNPLFYNAKLWHKMLANCFADKAKEIPLSEYFKSSDDLKFYEYAGEYYSSHILIECISPYGVTKTYKELIKRDLYEGKSLLDNIPSQDTTYHIGLETTYQYTLVPNLQITITHPTAGQDHYVFEPDGDGTKVTKEIEPN